MRTKALLGLAALVAGVFSAAAQGNVYSLNVVGYVNVTVPPSSTANGFTIVCNPLKNGNNDINTVLTAASLPQNLAIYRWDVPGLPAGYSISNLGTDDNGVPMWDQQWTIAPGEGFWVKNPTASPLSITFVGEVPTGTLPNPVPAGFALKGSVVPQSGDLADVLGYPRFIDPVNSANNTAIYFWTPATGYTIVNGAVDDNGNPTWDNTYPVGAPSGASPAIGQGFWTKEAAARTWTRDFTIP